MMITKVTMAVDVLQEPTRFKWLMVLSNKSKIWSKVTKLQAQIDKKSQLNVLLKHKHIEEWLTCVNSMVAF
jgi:hypothetical protein